MADRINRQWRVKSRPAGMISNEIFQWTEQPVTEPGEGQFLIRNLYLSFDPTQRAWLAGPTYVPAIEPGEVMRAMAVGQVIESKHADYQPGDFVFGGWSWQDYCVSDGEGMLGVNKLPPGVPIAMAMSVLGVTGLTAYFGMLEVGKPSKGETVVVSGAAGATGSVAAQIARIHGARAIGIAGGREKCVWLRDEVGLDGVIDYKSENTDERLGELCPKGVNVFFDNVGGETLEAVLNHLAIGARIAICGAISAYNAEAPPPGPRNYTNLIIYRARMQGFLVLDYADRFPEASAQIAQWVGEGKIKYQVDLQEGLENAPDTFRRIFSGKNRGKQLLRIAEAPLGSEP